MEPRNRNFRERFLFFSFLKIFLSFLFIFLSVIYISFKRWFLIFFLFLFFSTTASKNPKLCSDVVGHGEIVYSSIELIKTHESGALSERRHSSSRQNQHRTLFSATSFLSFRPKRPSPQAFCRAGGSASGFTSQHSTSTMSAANPSLFSTESYF